MEIIRTEDLTFTYPGQDAPVIKNINFTIQQGEFIVLFGESGSGKSTILKMIKRELTPEGKKGGAVFYKGKQLSNLDDRTVASEIGFVGQNPDLQIVTDKVWHELAFGLENLGESTQIIRSRVGEMANYFGIHHWFHKRTNNLSGGQKQLLNLASTIVMEPQVLILDEPTAQLDPIAAEEFISMIHQLNRDLGITILIVEHDLERVFPIADQIILLEKGEILLTGHPRNIGSLLKQHNREHKMLYALPSTVQICNQLTDEFEAPLTVREGRQFLTERFINHTVELEKEREINNNQNVLEMKNIWFRYERSTPDILKGLSLEVRKGEITTVLGGNGSGKTTLLNVLSGQKRAYRGQVKVKGKKIQKYKQAELYKHLLAYLPQNVQSIFLKSTVEEDYKEMSKVMKYDEAEYKNSIADITKLLSIENLLTKHPYDLSGGEQQKVALGKILLLKPKIILLDEPTKGMDAFAKLTLQDILFSLKQKGITTILVTHDVEFAAQVSDRCCLFFDGNIISEGNPEEFFSNNTFYTTAASRISRHQYNNTVTVGDVVKICRLNEEVVNG